MTLQAFLKPGGLMLLFRGPSGPDEPATFMAPLTYSGTQPLIEATRSRLTILSKRAIGGAVVPRGTTLYPNR